MGAERSLYEVLDVPPDATAEQIRHAYRSAARRTHPDTGGQASAFALVTVAYQVLSNPARRRRYDQQRATTAHPGTTSPHPGATAPSAPGPAPRDGPGAPSAAAGVVRPGADPVVRRRYLTLMGVALALFISGGAIVRSYSLPAAMIMMVVAALIPPIAVTVASRPRRPPDTPPPRPDEDGRRR